MRAAALLLLLCLLPFPAAAQDLAGHGGPVRALAVLPEGRGLASAGFDHSVILWDPARGRARRVVRWHDGAVNALAVLPGGGLASAGEDGRIALWPPDGAEAPVRVLEGHTAPVAALVAGPDGMLASAGWDGTVRLWAPDGTARVLEGHAGPVNGLARLPASLASAGYDGTVRLWDAQGRGRVLAEFGVPQNALLALPDGMLASAGADGAVRLIAPDGTVRELAAGTRPVVALAAAPDGGMLAAASLGGSVTLWSLPEGRLLRELNGPGLPVWSVAFAADGRTLWTGGQDRLVRHWDVATGGPLGPLANAADAAVRPGLDAHGARVFRACAACHSLTAEGGNMAGPTLHGLFGRRMGSVPGYHYSERLARGDIIWTPETVADLFTRGPDVVTPGTKMPVQRVEEPADLAALIRFLQQATR
ncbi:MAG: c-type cytochrome [Acetobacteraceae bacterium]|nr:c-type cytochrome [Acetobacteraceae bacterium]MDI3309688.1 c-type cytochrome [Acetobacteraceae bacterium]